MKSKVLIKKIIHQLNGFIDNNNNNQVNTINPEIAKELKEALEAIEDGLNVKKKTKDKEEKIEIEKRIQTTVEKLEQKLIFLFEKPQTTEGENFFAEQFYYDILIFLTRLRPRNNFDIESFEFLDPISHMPVKEEDRVYATTRYFYDINALAKYLRIIKPIFNPKTGVYNARCLDPVTTHEFSPKDRFEIQRVATRQGVPLPSFIATSAITRDNPDNENYNNTATSNNSQNYSADSSLLPTSDNRAEGTEINEGEQESQREYDAYGNLTYRSDNVPGSGQRIQRYSYHALGWLLSISTGGNDNELTTQHFYYDASGNRIEPSTNPSNDINTNYTYDIFNESERNNTQSLSSQLNTVDYQNSTTHSDLNVNSDTNPIASDTILNNPDSRTQNANNEFINNNDNTTPDNQNNGAEENDSPSLFRLLSNNNSHLYQGGIFNDVSASTAGNNNNVTSSVDLDDDSEENSRVRGHNSPGSNM
ncbi:MAG: hypothetical protein H0U71_08320 [Gammaproteobacteria bacterium]|nr:hypothetical protein [Gammaproteobacteria bacterium]